MAVLLLFSRTFPFLLSEVPFGYDTGIYRFEFWSSFQALPEYASQLFLGLPLISNVFQLFGVGVDGLMGWFYAVVSLLLPASLFLMARRLWGSWAAVMVLFLFLISLIQWKAYTMVLFKQELALALSFFSIFLLDKRSWLVLLVLPFVALLQPLDAFLVAVSFFIFGLFSIFQPSFERKYYLSLLLVGAISGVALLALDPLFWQQSWDLFSQGIVSPDSLEDSLQQGIFLSLSDFGYQSALFFVFGMLGFVLDWKRRKNLSLLSVYFCVIFVWIAFGLFFYQRLLIHLDAVLLLFSAFALVHFARAVMVDRWGKWLIVLVFLVMMVPLFFTFKRFQPLIEFSELKKIERFCEQLPKGAYVAATDSFYGPWLRGYCLDQKVFGPGLFPDNRWSRSEWQSFWDRDLEVIPSLLERYDSEVYFYRGEQQFQLEFDAELFEWVEGGWWRNAPPPSLRSSSSLKGGL
jgi:hypothetical protein